MKSTNKFEEFKYIPQRNDGGDISLKGRHHPAKSAQNIKLQINQELIKKHMEKTEAMGA
ncbi:MAG: hypothetical protein HY804_13690 [Nitrospinae bacterium]|nr:hypothetical protein [Nitrospinota bacterium]